MKREWARQVIDRLSFPNPVLMDEFERTYERIGGLHA
jgi:hypothetical protein